MCVCVCVCVGFFACSTSYTRERYPFFTPQDGPQTTKPNGIVGIYIYIGIMEKTMEATIYE